ncbi:MAG: proton-conducting transporter membrane subunit [Deltaproteobacteria bacterium]|nr:proton-conducting transporter membrane subunit [Deltaproteobacteria bacterium]
MPLLLARWHLEIDRFSAPFMALAAGVTAAVLVGAPRRSLTRRVSPTDDDLMHVAKTALLTLGSAVGVYCSVDLLILSGFLLVGLLPSATPLTVTPGDDLAELRRVSRIRSRYGLVATLPILLATVVVARSRFELGSPTPFDLSDPRAMHGTASTVVFALLALALLARKAVAPLHSWMPVALIRGPIAVSVLSVSTHLGAFLALRVLPILVPESTGAGLRALAMVALASAMYQAIVALGQRNMARAVAYVINSQLAMVLVGIGTSGLEGLHGSLLQMLSIGLVATGLLLTVAWVEARAGSTDLSKLGGLARDFPRLAWSFLLFGLVAVGAPGTLSWVAEDLLLQSLLSHHPVIAAVLLLTTMLHGITILRVFFQAFFGKPRFDTNSELPDLVRYERTISYLLLITIAGLGLAPQAIIVLQRPAIDAMLHVTEAIRHEVGTNAPNLTDRLINP